MTAPAMSEIREDPANGEVTLLARYDPRERTYGFRFIDLDYPDEVTSHLVYDPKLAVERLIRRLDALAGNAAGFSAAAARSYLVNEGVALWQELIPEALRSQFWERQQRITQLTILSDSDVVPWELLYPMDHGHDTGFLVEQFPIMRAIYGRPRQSRLRLHPARFVVPSGSPADAQAEAEALARLLGTNLTTVSDLIPLLELIDKGDFGLLHFACHNRFDPGDGSSIKLDSPFTPIFLNIAASNQTLASAAPLIFINACRSVGQVPSYNKLDNWADKFLRAGAAAFIAPSWEVSCRLALEFAQELYKRLLGGHPLGTAVMDTRRALANEPDDPTWLAYQVYGNPKASIWTGARYVFISYVREDSLKVDRLQRALEAAGLRVWRDTANLWPGEDWREKIRQAIQDDALVFIACFSHASVARSKSYQNEEFTLAIEQMRLRRPDEPWLIPVRLDDCEIPDRDIGGGRTLTSIQRADLSGDRFDDGAAKLIKSIRRIFGRQAGLS